MSLDSGGAAPLRRVLDDVLTADECAELIFAQRSSCNNGYMPRVTVARFFEMARCESLELGAPALASAREKIRDLIEAEADDAVLVHFEWSAIVCWRAGASLNAHFDRNRPYLKQRHWSAVVYLNDANAASDDESSDDGLDAALPAFSGGALHFEEPALTVNPRRGRCVLFSSGDENMHRVSRVERGERYALTLWFTRDDEAAEPESEVLAEFVAAAATPSRSAWARLPPAWEGDGDRESIWAERLLRAGGLRITRWWASSSVLMGVVVDELPARAEAPSSATAARCELGAMLRAAPAIGAGGAAVEAVFATALGAVALRCVSLRSLVALAAFCAWTRNAPLAAVAAERSTWRALRRDWCAYRAHCIARFQRCVAAWSESGIVGRPVE